MNLGIYYVLLKGEDKNGKINLSKRYSDFDHLRQALTIRWPAIYIPPLPEKKALVLNTPIS